MLTDLQIRALKPPASGQRDLADGADVKGLVLRVSRRARVFYLIARAPGDGRPVRHRLGEYPAMTLAEARDAGRKLRALLDRGIDPREHERQEAARARAEAAIKERGSVATVITDYVLHCQRAGQRRWRERERHLRVYLPVDWLDRPLASIGRGDVRELLARLERDRGPVQANRVVQTLRAMINWAIRDGRHTSANPAADLRSVIPEASRDRVLSDAELAAIWRSAGELGAPFGVFVRFLALTAQRRGEVATLRWRDVNLDAAAWEIPAALQKQGRVHGVPLSPPALAILEALPRCGEYAFSGSDGRAPLSGFSRAKRRLDRMLPPDMPAWTIHDLRRTAASGMARLGIAPHVAEKVLGHEPAAIRGVAAIYNRHDYGDEKRRALEAWARHVLTIADTSGSVVTAR